MLESPLGDRLESLMGVGGEMFQLTATQIIVRGTGSRFQLSSDPTSCSGITWASHVTSEAQFSLPSHGNDPTHCRGLMHLGSFYGSLICIRNLTY